MLYIIVFGSLFVFGNMFVVGVIFMLDEHARGALELRMAQLSPAERAGMRLQAKAGHGEVMEKVFTTDMDFAARQKL